MIIVNPELKMPALTEFAGGGGPIIPGPLFPFCFITIACGAISGFHALISSGTTPKMIDKETRHPADRLRRDADRRPGRHHGAHRRHRDAARRLLRHQRRRPRPTRSSRSRASRCSTCTSRPIEAAVGETVDGRTGGAVSLAVGMAQIFSALPGMSGLLAYWYHFAIMFEALFILTTIDSGTRVGRFLMQEALGRIYAPFAQHRLDARGATSPPALMVAAWGYFVYTGNIGDDLADVRRRQPAARLRRAGDRDDDPHQQGKARYTWVTLVPFAFLAVNTLLRRLPQHPRQLLAADAEQRPVGGHRGLRAVDLHGADDDPGRGHPRRRLHQVGQRAVVQRPRAAAGGGLMIRAWLRAFADGVRQFLELAYVEPTGC